MGKSSRRKWERRQHWPLSKSARLNKLQPMPQVMEKIDGLCMDAFRMRDEREKNASN